MKKFILFLAILTILSNLVIAQSTKPLIIKGQLKNCPESTLIVFFFEDGKTEFDTIQVDHQGNFYLKTYKIKTPQKTSIQKNSTQINDFYVAPGYELTLEGDASDFMKLVETLKITGKGAKANSYRQEKFAYNIKNRDTTQYWMLNPESTLTFANKKWAIQDSIAKHTVGLLGSEEEYLQEIKQIIAWENDFIRAYYLLFAVNESKMNHEESIDYITTNIPVALLQDFSKEEFLQSSEYRNVALREYIKFHNTLDAKKDPESVKVENYTLSSINKLLTGEVRDYYLTETILRATFGMKNLEQLEQVKTRIAPYLASISKTNYIQQVNDEISQKETELSTVKKGNLAPVFNLPSDKGVMHSLTNYRGKVVYIDFWASWCGPCREETPALKALHDKYKNDDRVVFISIAVSDGEKEWRKALEEDQPTWLQLYDQEKTTNKSYLITSIPKFVLLDKAGKIVDFNAPRPSNAEKLEELLLQEMQK